MKYVSHQVSHDSSFDQSWNVSGCVWREQLADLRQSGSEGLMLLYRYRTVSRCIGCSCPLAPLLAACYSTFPIPTVSTKEQRCTCSADTFQHGCVKIRRESNNQKSWSSAAHMGNVKAWKWVPSFFSVYIYWIQLHQCCCSCDAVITLPSWNYLNTFYLAFYC